MSLWKKVAVAGAGFALLTGFSVSALRVGDEMKLFVDLMPVELPDGYELLHVGDRLYVPLRFVSEQMGKAVFYDEEAREVNLSDPHTVYRSNRSASASEESFTLTLYEGWAVQSGRDDRREPHWWAELRYTGEEPLTFTTHGLDPQLIQFEFDYGNNQRQLAGYFDVGTNLTMQPGDVAMAVAPSIIRKRYEAWDGRNMQAVCKLYIGDRSIDLRAAFDAP